MSFDTQHDTCQHERWDRYLRRCKDCKRTEYQLAIGDNGPPHVIDEFTLRRIMREVMRRYTTDEKKRTNQSDA